MSDVSEGECDRVTKICGMRPNLLEQTKLSTSTRAVEGAHS